MILVHSILMFYFWRLISHRLPPQKQVPSSFIPLAPLSQGASGFLNLSVSLAAYLQKTLFTPTRSAPPPLPQNPIWAVGEALHYLGILVALQLLSHATFWAVQASFAMIARPQSEFTIGTWSLVFPAMSYTAAWASVARDLDNEGLRGLAAALTVVVSVIWLMCSGFTVWRGIITGGLFIPLEAYEKRNDISVRMDNA